MALVKPNCIKTDTEPPLASSSQTTPLPVKNTKSPRKPYQREYTKRSNAYYTKSSFDYINNQLKSSLKPKNSKISNDSKTKLNSKLEAQNKHLFVNHLTIIYLQL
ncbi:hypothetical protein BC833DRAFT_112077 [Globomyces pollinis-pini]|nr:hypothetical protein BC833DRAFT_112077 [Globomyces pollinis-pini]